MEITFDPDMGMYMCVDLCECTKSFELNHRSDAPIHQQPTHDKSSHTHKVTYAELLTVLWDRHDPTTKDRQGNDVGTQYRSAYVFSVLDLCAYACVDKLNRPNNPPHTRRVYIHTHRIFYHSEEQRQAAQASIREEQVRFRSGPID